MNICAITMVYKDYWALSQWYAHYGRMLGFDNLYIVAHGADAKVASLCPRATVITVPRETLEGFDRRRGQVLNSFADGLAVSFDWVIRTDADELICYDPALYTSLHAVLETATAKSMFALGLNVAETLEDDVLAEGQMALGHRRTAVFSGHYSKAWVTKRGTGLWRHGIWVGPKRIETAVFDLPRGVYLMHLKYANIDALETASIGPTWGTCRGAACPVPRGKRRTRLRHGSMPDWRDFATRHGRSRAITPMPRSARSRCAMPKRTCCGRNRQCSSSG